MTAPPPVNPDDLSGRPLDAAIARHVFGLEIEERTNTKTGAKDWVCREPGKQWLVVSFYGSLAASVKLNVELQRLGWQVKASPFGRRPDPAGTYLVTLVNGEQQVDAAGRSYEEALGRAALKAVQP